MSIKETLIGHICKIKMTQQMNKKPKLSSPQGAFNTDTVDKQITKKNIVKKTSKKRLQYTSIR